MAFRGNERREIFRDDTDREALLARLAERAERYQVRLYLYCLMANHAHLVVETPRGNLSDFMGSLLTSYANYFNARHRRAGHLMQGRFKSPLVKGDEYLLRLSRYLHLNPVFVKDWETRSLRERIKHLQEYRWSSYRSYIGLAQPVEFVDYSPTLAMTQSRRGAERKAYRRYVEAGLAQTDEEFMEILKRSSIGIGSETFLRGLTDRQTSLSGKRVKAEDVAFRRVRAKRDAADVVKAVCAYYRMTHEELRKQRKRHWAKAAASELLMRYAGLTQREVAGWVGVGTGAAVCLQLRKLRADGGAAAERAINRIEQILNI